MTKTLSFKRWLFIFLILLSFYQGFSQDKKDTANAGNVLSQVEVEASFPGGAAAWNKYVSNAMSNANLEKFKKADQGTCRVRFIVDAKGYVSNVEAITMKKTRLAKLAIDIIENGPRWQPAQQNGKFVNAYREQPITLTIEKEK